MVPSADMQETCMQLMLICCWSAKHSPGNPPLIQARHPPLTQAGPLAMLHHPLGAVVGETSHLQANFQGGVVPLQLVQHGRFPQLLAGARAGADLPRASMPACQLLGLSKVPLLIYVSSKLLLWRLRPAYDPAAASLQCVCRLLVQCHVWSLGRSCSAWTYSPSFHLGLAFLV